MVLSITLAETRTDASQAPSALDPDWSTVVRLLPHVRRQHCREKTLISRDARSLGSPNAQRRPASIAASPAGFVPSTSSRTSDQRSDTATHVSAENPRASPPASGARASNTARLSLGMRTGSPNAALPSHAPRSTTIVVPARLLFSEGIPPRSPPGHADAVGFWCGQADTETPRFRLKLDSTFLRDNSGRSTLFPAKEESTRLATSPPFYRSGGWKPYSLVGPLLPPTRDSFLKSCTWRAGPLSSLHTPLC